MLDVIAFSLLLFAKDDLILDPAKDQPPPANTVFFADCFKDATERGDLKAQNGYLLINCRGEAALRFYDKLGTLPETATFAETIGSRSLRYTVRPRKNTDGLDACWRDSHEIGTAAEYGCRLVYPAGPLLDAK